MEKPLILITNDDGIHAEGIRKLVDFIADLGDVLVVAPDAPRSGGSSSITCNTILRAKAFPNYGAATMLAVNGTPADCVKLALNALVPRRPAILLSGINHGANTGNSVVYSGTMGAALEGCMQKLPSIGYSLATHHPVDSEFDACRAIVYDLTAAVLRNGLPEGVCLNVNFPAGGTVKGMRRARACRGQWTEEFARFNDPDGHPFYMLTGKYRNDEPEATDTDLYCLSEGYASLVPTVPDRDYNGALPGIL